jgi:nicotinate-nucleotide--dimethylbenzimidazole phosphoribosyltransferase
VLVDGFPSGVAALAAVCMNPRVSDTILLSHASAETGSRVLVAALARHGVAPPPLQMGMRLGEATGALLCVPMLRGACAVLRDMGSLQETLSLSMEGSTDPHQRLAESSNSDCV